MSGAWFDSKITVAMVITVAIQAAAILFWTGAAAQRLQAAEDKLARQDLIAERLARIEAKLDDLTRRQERTEAR